MFYPLRDIEIELWNKAKAKATLEPKTMGEVIFESLKCYITPVEPAASPNKNKKGKKKHRGKGKDGCRFIRLPVLLELCWLQDYQYLEIKISNKFGKALLFFLDKVKGVCYIANDSQYR